MTIAFSSAFLIDDIRLMAHLGIYDAERATRQPIAISIRLYFPSPPAWTFDDTVNFFDYQILVEQLTEMVEVRSFRLIEYMAQESLALIRKHLDSIDASHFKIWLKLTKLAPPIASVKGGASFVMTDLPIGAPVLDVG
jgi:dihydroneopterin aldolase